jgi:hypothetical protein
MDAALKAEVEAGPARPYSLFAMTTVGRDFDRMFETFKVERDLIVLKGRRWTKNDAHCCPSLDTTTSYRFGSYGLTEIR